MSRAFSSSIRLALIGAHGFGVTDLDTIGSVARIEPHGAREAELIALTRTLAPSAGTLHSSRVSQTVGARGRQAAGCGDDAWPPAAALRAGNMVHPWKGLSLPGASLDLLARFISPTPEVQRASAWSES